MPVPAGPANIEMSCYDHSMPMSLHRCHGAGWLLILLTSGCASHRLLAPELPAPTEQFSAPDTSRVWYARALRAEASEDPTAAQLAYGWMALLDSRSPWVYLAAGRYHARQDDWFAAARAYQKATEQAPHLAQAQGALGHALAQIEDPLADDVLWKAAQLGSPLGCETLATRVTNPDRRAELLSLWLLLDLPPDRLLARARLALDSGDADSAWRDLEHSMSHAPSPEAFALWVKAGEATCALEAVWVWARRHASWAEDPAWSSVLAALATRLDDKPLEKALATSGNLSLAATTLLPAYCAIPASLTKAESLDSCSAITTLEESLRAYPTHPGVLDALGDATMRCGDLGRALALIQRAVDLHPTPDRMAKRDAVLGAWGKGRTSHTTPPTPEAQ